MAPPHDDTSSPLQDELNQLKASRLEAESEQRGRAAELRELRELHAAEQQLREKLARRLETATDKAAKAQLL